MSIPDFAGRMQLAETLKHLESEIAEAVTQQFFQAHPDWLEHYGERGVEHGIEDARFHMRFLAGSIEAGDPKQFADYAQWTARVLESRGIKTHFLTENFEQIQDALQPRLSAAHAACAGEHLQAGIRALRQPESPRAPDMDTTERAPEPTAHGTEAPATSTLALTRGIYTQAILNGDRTAAANIISEALREGADPLDIYVDVLQKALYEVGRLWETNRLTVAQEHMATAITQYVLSLYHSQLPRSDTRRGNVIITGIQGELHQVGPMMLADVLEMDGWNVRFLGSDMPSRDILEAIEAHGANVLGISATMLFNVPQVHDLIRKSRERSGDAGIHIAVGGRAFRSAPELYKEIGADGFAPDLRLGRDLIRKWG